jgi:hypothetical protein
MNAIHREARRSLLSAFIHRRKDIQQLAERLREALATTDNPDIRLAFHELSAAIEGRIAWETANVLPILGRDAHANEAGCASHVRSDHKILLRLLDDFGHWLVEQPLALERAAREAGLRHFERLWQLLQFHDRREADYTYPALAMLLDGNDLMRLARAMASGAPLEQTYASAA